MYIKLNITKTKLNSDQRLYNVVNCIPTESHVNPIQAPNTLFLGKTSQKELSHKKGATDVKRSQRANIHKTVSVFFSSGKKQY